MSDDNKEGAAEPVADARTLKTHARNLRSDSVAVKQVYDHLQAMAEEIEILAYATPPAVLPAAPSDAEILAVLPPKSGIAPSNLEAVRQGLVGAFRPVWTEPAMLEFARSVLALSQTRQTQAEPAAGEQAGAVAAPGEGQRVALNDERIVEIGHRRAWRYKFSSDPHHSSTYTFNRQCLIEFARELTTLAAPGAAIAAREQQTGDEAFRLKKLAGQMVAPVGRGYAEGWKAGYDAALASPKEAPATPHGEAAGLSEVTERHCNKCGYFGPDQIHYRPNGLGECGYIARILTQPTTVQQAEKGGV